MAPSWAESAPWPSTCAAAVSASATSTRWPWAFPLGMAVGCIGDVVNGEHFGPPSDLPWAFRYVHPDVEVPSAALAYHSGGFYEVVPALLLLALVLWLRRRVSASGVLLFAVVGAYSLGRFAMFFWRSDSAPALLGLDGGPGHEPGTRRSLPLEPTAREPFVPSSGSQASDTR